MKTLSESDAAAYDAILCHGGSYRYLAREATKLGFPTTESWLRKEIIRWRAEWTKRQKARAKAGSKR